MKRRIPYIIALVSLIGVALILYFAGPQIFGSVIAPLPDEYSPIVRKYAQEMGVDSCFVAAVIRGESNWNPGAHSGAGAQGMMQLIPGTASAIASRAGIPYSRSQIREPDINIRLGTALIRYNLDHYGSIRNVLVAYNAGGGRVNLPDRSLPRETQVYIVKITQYYSLYTSLYPSFCTGMDASKRFTEAGSSGGENFPDFVAPSPSPSVVPVDINNFWKFLLTQ